MEEIIPGTIKKVPSDFIVEEIGEDWECKTQEKFISQVPNLSNLKEKTGEFLFCELEKFDIDHFSALKDTARLLSKGLDSIGYAGIKDKRAHTSQRISIFNPDLSKLASFKHPNINLKNFRWSKRKIRIGYLNSNRFKITIRDLDKKESIKIQKKIQKMPWFPNYFGQQRFGSIRNNNVKIGKLILKRKFKEAVWEILTGFSNKENESIKRSREKLRKDKDFQEALNYYPSSLRQERSILNYLSRNPEDYLGSIKNSERKGILIYVNSVQSYIFNEILRRALDEGLDFSKKGQENCILPGYKTRFYQGRLGEIEKEVLSENNIELSDFDIKEIPYLRMKGSFRKAITKIKDLEITLEDDELFEGSKKIILKFELPSGVYATTYLNNFFILNEH